MLRISGVSEHVIEKVYEVYILFVLSWCAVSIGTGAASYKRLVKVSQIFSAFSKSFYRCIRILRSTSAGVAEPLPSFKWKVWGRTRTTTQPPPRNFRK